VSDEIQNEVVWLVTAGEVLAAVVDHFIGTERPHELELAAIVDAGDVRAEAFGQLDGEGTRPPATTVDQRPAPLGGSHRALQGDRAGLRDRRCLGERESARLQGE
jgi:hypothetical protein